jgi:hypothetical protein
MFLGRNLVKLPKRLHFLEADMIIIKKTEDLRSAQRIHLLYFFGLLRTESLTAFTLSSDLAVGFLPELGVSAFLLRLLY